MTRGIFFATKTAKMLLHQIRAAFDVHKCAKHEQVRVSSLLPSTSGFAASFELPTLRPTTYVQAACTGQMLLVRLFIRAYARLPWCFVEGEPGHSTRLVLAE